LLSSEHEHVCINKCRRRQYWPALTALKLDHYVTFAKVFKKSVVDLQMTFEWEG